MTGIAIPGDEESVKLWMVLALQINVSIAKIIASEQAVATKVLAASVAIFRYRRSDPVWALGVSYQNWKMLGVILYNKLLKMLWGNCVPQESLETSVESRMWNGFKLRIGIVVGMLNYEVVVGRAPGCLRLFAF
jgi:hypothetical protein